MSLHSPLKLFVGGCGMITSCSVWLFEHSSNPIASPMTLNSSSSKGSIRLDSLTAVDKLTDWQGKEIKDENVEIESYIDNYSVTLRFKDNPSRQSATLIVVNAKIDKFAVYGNSTKDDYEKFDRSQIKISLFKKAAWNSDSKKEEYEELDDTQIKELFEGLEEVRVKQLLLALSHKLEWNFFGSNSYNFNWSFAMNLDDLKNLKIRHFQEFSRLRDYVKKKVPTCKDDTRACFPHVDEIDYLEMDRREYFEKAWNNQRK